MKKFNIIGLLLIALLLPVATAQKGNDKAGITPDSFLWNVEVALDNLNLLLTFNPTEKTKKGIEIARDRLEEVKAMVEENKLDAAEKAKEEEVKVLSKVKASISDIKDKNSTKQIEEEIEIEKELEEHEDEVKEVSDNLKIKVEIKGMLNEQQKALLDSLLSSLENKTGEVKVEIQSKKDKTKIEIKQETGKSEKDVDDEIENIEEEQGLADIKKEHATEEIDNAKENLGDLEKELQEQKSKGHVANETSITNLVENAKEKIIKAEEAFKNNDFGEAFGQADAAEQLIKNAERILEKTVGKFEEKGGKHEEKREIEVELYENESKVKIEIGDTKSKFTLGTTDKNTIIKEIAERTGLSIDEVTKLAKFEEEKEKEEKKVTNETTKAEEKDKKKIEEVKEEDKRSKVQGKENEGD